MIKRISHLSLLLLFVFSLPNTLKSQNFEAYNITADSLVSLENQIRNYYTTVLSKYNDILLEEDAITEIMALMNLLFSIPTSGNCNEGEIIDMQVGSSASGNSLEVVWGEEANADGYFGVYIDLRLSRQRPFSYNISRFTNRVGVEVPDYVDKKFYAFNGRCGADNQSSYYIIIIEKDLDYSSNQEPEEGGGNNGSGGGQTGQQVNSNTFSVYPNPVNSTFSKLQFYLSTEQEVSASIINSNGQLVKTIFQRKLFEEGSNQTPLNLTNLPAGIYFIIFETKEGPVSQKLVIL